MCTEPNDSNCQYCMQFSNFSPMPCKDEARPSFGVKYHKIEDKSACENE